MISFFPFCVLLYDRFTLIEFVLDVSPRFLPFLMYMYICRDVFSTVNLYSLVHMIDELDIESDYQNVENPKTSLDISFLLINNNGSEILTNIV